MAVCQPTHVGQQMETSSHVPSPFYGNHHQRTTVSLISAVPCSDSWREVTPPTTNMLAQSGRIPLHFSQVFSVLSFRSFVYVGKAVPLVAQPSCIPTGISYHPFQGIFMFTAADRESQCVASEILEKANSKNIDYVTGKPCDKDCEYFYHKCEFDYNKDEKDEETDSDSDSDKEEEEENSNGIVEFVSSSQVDVAKCPDFLAPPLSHTFSFSSEESGFCENSHIEWSDDETDDETNVECNFDEGLWHVFEQQACFTGIPLKTDKKKKTPCEKTALLTNDCYTNFERKKLARKDTKHNLSPLSSSSINHNTTSGNTCSATGNEHTLIVTHTRDKEFNTDANSCRKRVSFKPDSELVVVHYIIAWAYAYRACRRGPWEQLAADRERFSRRIQTVDSILAPCLLEKLTLCSSS